MGLLAKNYLGGEKRMRLAPFASNPFLEYHAMKIALALCVLDADNARLSLA
jgi:hypothetical protein